jgi:hypothetical protein
MQKLRERIRKFRERLIYCAEIESEIQHADFKKLKALRAKLSDEMGEPIGIPTMMGLPVVFSLFFSVLSFIQPQLVLWLAIFDWLQLPQHTVFVGICITALLFSSINAVIVSMIGKGSMAAIKAHLMIMGLTLAMSVVYFVNVLLDCINGSVAGVDLITAILGIVFITFSIMIILSPAFYKMMVFCLHNRAFRKSLLLMRNMKGKRGQWREWNK